MMVNNTSGGGALRSLHVNADREARASNRLSSGLRINGASDDAAGLAIAQKLLGQVRGVSMASRNASDSISMIRTGEGALAETHSNLQRMRELAVQASNGIYTDSDRRNLQAEVKELQAEITRIGNATEFNTRRLLDGSAEGQDNAVMSQIGANSGQTTFTQIGDMRAEALGVSGLDVSTVAGASSAIEAIDEAIAAVSSQRSQLGASENRLDHTVANLDVAAENQTAAASRIRDADLARETIMRTTADILRQTSLAMVAQANMARQSVMRLFG